MIFQAMVQSYALKRNRMQTLHSKIGSPGLKSPAGTNCWNPVWTEGGNIWVLPYGTSSLKTVLNIKKQSHTHLNRMVGQNVSIIYYWINTKRCDNMHVYHQLSGRIKTSLHIYNRQPMCHLNWYSPIHLWNGTKPDISYFRTFGCWAYVLIPKDKWANKLAPKSEDMMFIGYEPGTKGYHFWSRIRRMVVISSAATFDEFDFPNCPREKLLDKPPPPKHQSPETSDSGDMDHDHNDQGGDNGH